MNVSAAPTLTTYIDLKCFICYDKSKNSKGLIKCRFAILTMNMTININVTM